MGKRAISILSLLFFLVFSLLEAWFNPLQAKAYSNSMNGVGGKLIFTGASDSLEYVNGAFILNEGIRLEGNATLNAVNAVLYFNFSSSRVIEAYGNSTVIMNNVTLVHSKNYNIDIYLYENSTASIEGAILPRTAITLYSSARLTLINSTLTRFINLYENASCSIEECSVTSINIYDQTAASIAESKMETIILEFDRDSEIHLTSLPIGFIDSWRLRENNVANKVYVDVNITGSRVGGWELYARWKSKVSAESLEGLRRMYAYSNSKVSLHNLTANDLFAYDSANLTLHNLTINNLYAYDSANISVKDSTIERTYLEFEGNATLDASLKTGFFHYWNLEENSTLAENVRVSLQIKDSEVKGWGTYILDSSNISLTGSTLSTISIYDNAEASLRNSTIYSLNCYENSTVKVSGSTLDYCLAYDYADVMLVDSTVKFTFYIRFRDAEVEMSLPSGFIGYWNLYENSTIGGVHINITVINGQLNRWRLTILGRSSFLLRDSATLDRLYVYGESAVYVQNSTIASLYLYDSSNLTMRESAVNYLYLEFERDSNLTLKGLSRGFINYWALQENATVSKSYIDLSINNSEVKNWYIYVRGESHVSLEKSEINYIYYYGDTVGSISQSAIHGLYAYEESHITLTNTTANYLGVYDFAEMLVENSAIKATIYLEFIWDSKVSAALPTGIIRYWSLNGNGSVTRAYISFMLKNTQVDGWGAYVYDASEISVGGSQLNYAYLYGCSSLKMFNSSINFIYTYDISKAIFVNAISSGGAYAHEMSTMRALSSRFYRIRAYSISSIHLINCSIIYESAVYHEAEILVGWLLTLRTLNYCGDPVEGVRVQVETSLGESIYDNVTDSSGTLRTPLWQKLIHPSGVEVYGNYSINVSKGAYTNQTILKTIDGNIDVGFVILSDADGDGLYDCEENLAGTNVNDADTDDDGLTDYQEVHVYGTDPLNADTDKDGIPDQDEINMGTNPLVETTVLADLQRELEAAKNFSSTLQEELEAAKNVSAALQGELEAMEALLAGLQRNLEAIRMMMYTFLATTVILSIVVIYLMARRRK